MLEDVLNSGLNQKSTVKEKKWPGLPSLGVAGIGREDVTIWK